MNKFVLPGILLLLLAGCANPPRQELQAARMAVARAAHAGAEELAAQEYKEAIESLKLGEEAVRRKDYGRGRDILTLTRDQADLAFSRAGEELDRLRHLRSEAEAPYAPPPTARTRPLRLPPPPAPPMPAPKTAAEPKIPAPPVLMRHIVEDNETLWTIAARRDVYGDPLLWPLLYQANRDQIRDPRKVFPGQQINIPRGHSPSELEEIRSRALRSKIFPLPDHDPSSQ